MKLSELRQIIKEEIETALGNEAPKPNKPQGQSYDQADIMRAYKNIGLFTNRDGGKDLYLNVPMDQMSSKLGSFVARHMDGERKELRKTRAWGMKWPKSNAVIPGYASQLLRDEDMYVVLRGEMKQSVPFDTEGVRYIKLYIPNE